MAVPDIFHGDPWKQDADFSNFMPWKAKHSVDDQMKELDILLEEFHLLYKPKSVAALVSAGVAGTLPCLLAQTKCQQLLWHMEALSLRTLWRM